jgi:hypothetical protein
MVSSDKCSNLPIWSAVADGFSDINNIISRIIRGENENQHVVLHTTYVKNTIHYSYPK